MRVVSTFFVFILYFSVAIVAAALLPFATVEVHAQQQQPTKLDQYVSAPESVFGWQKVGSTIKNNSEFSLDTFNMTSQTWLTPANSDKAIWRHQLVVVTPTNIDPQCDTAFLWITWGSDNSNTTVPGWKPTGQNDMDLLVTADAAVNARCFGLMLYQVPDQPICWPQADGTRFCGSEDAAIGYTFQQFFEQNKSAEHMLLFPMTKAGVKAMDAGEQIFSQVFNHPIKNWVVSGASKRGWTTYLVGATDPKRYQRIKAIVPVVLDAINFESFLKREYQSYNQAYSWVVRPYRVLAAYVNTSRWSEWAANIDPYFYRQRLTMPKFIVNAVGDEFQLVDDQRHWVKDMPGETKTLMVFDADHPLFPNIVTPLEAIRAFAQSVHLNTARPSYDWSIDATTGQITVNTSVPPKDVKVYWATAPPTGRRDFRNTVLSTSPCTIKIIGGCLRFIPWNHTDPVANSATSFSTNIPAPADGEYVGFFIQLTFQQEGGKLSDFIFASPANVLPYNIYPTDQMCKGQACLNVTLV